jgi:hypothetical protein
MTLPLEAPALDLEALAGLDLDPEYVLAFVPPCVYAQIQDRLTRPGWWELLAIADYEAGNPARDDWTLDAPRDTPVGGLAAWVRGVLGHPVALESDTWELKPGRRLARWHAEPLFWVRRDT